MIFTSTLSLKHYILSEQTHFRNSLSLITSNMPIQVAKTISIDARNTLVRNRDALQTKHNVQIFFPKSLVRGAFQDMIIKGGVTATANAEREIDSILITWRQEFDAFKQRQAYRKTRRNQITEQPPHFPTIAEASKSKSNTKTTAVNNRFAILENIDPTPDVSLPAPTPKTNTKTPVLKGWANIAAKPATQSAPAPNPKPHTQPISFETMSWADIAEQEDFEEEEDWPITDDRWGTGATSWADM